MIELYLRALPIEPSVLVLLAVCVVAALTDVASRRIPNWLVLVGLATVVLLQYSVYGLAGIKLALIGTATAFAITVALMLAKVLAAGDSKLMLVVGAALGYEDLMVVLLLALLLSGVIALFGSLLTRRFRVLKANLTHGLLSAVTFDWAGVKSMADQTAFRVPFAVPVLFSVGAWLKWVY